MILLVSSPSNRFLGTMYCCCLFFVVLHGGFLHKTCLFGFNLLDLDGGSLHKKRVFDVLFILPHDGSLLRTNLCLSVLRGESRARTRLV